MGRVTSINMTVKQAHEVGLVDMYSKYQRGYVSRKIDVGTCKLQISGDGRIYYNAPAGNTTQYCLRVYMDYQV